EFLGPRGGRGRRWQVAAYHIWRLEESALIRPGVLPLDLLGGSVIGGATPIARHGVELEGGISLDGFGLRAEAEYIGSARVDGGAAGASDLAFGDVLLLDLRAFVDFDRRPRLIAALPLLRGARLSLRIDNLLGDIRRVTDAAGNVPLSFQPALLDPRGRFVELSLRKRF
ncbi:MAG: ABC transporter ATP-binding protein, partial [Sphingomonadaceae bacterium]|nr:ABC transporter ATP-binding protein [Sphingomonadaceae bacterium]